MKAVFTFCLFLVVWWAEAQPTVLRQPTLLDETTLTQMREVASVEEALSNPLNVYKINLSGQGITAFPKGILQCKNLQSLNLSKNNIKNLPKEIQNLTNLQYLNLTACGLTDFPIEVTKLTNLTWLQMPQNSIASIPKEIEKLQNLRYLEIASPYLQNIPIEVGKLKNLTSLYLSGNSLTYLPKEIGNLANLNSLHLAYNQLTEIPKEIGNLTNLQYLHLTQNKLESLPKELGNLKRLYGLYASRNHLTTLPAEIGKLGNLTDLYLSENRLTTLPTEYNQLRKLTYLHIFGNTLQTLPEAFSALENIAEPVMYANHWATLPTDWVKKTYLIQHLLEDDIKSLRNNPNGEKLYLQFREQYALDKLNLMRIDVYGAWWHNQNGHYAKAKAIIQHILTNLKAYQKEDSTQNDYKNKTLLATIEGNTLSIRQGIDMGVSVLSAKEQAEVERQTAVEQKKLAQEKEQEAHQAKEQAISEKHRADHEKNIAQQNQEKAQKAEKEAHIAEEQAHFQRNLAIGGGVLALTFAGLALVMFFKQQKEKAKSEALLLNILPKEVAQELKEKGVTEVRQFDSATVLFADVKGFSAFAAKVTAKELIAELNTTFSKMDEIILKHQLERIKTIGDCYMAVGGVPNPLSANAVEMTLAALEIQRWMEVEKKARGGKFWEVRLGMHTGELVAGVIGKTKFAYDVWGNAVNLASRMESGGKVGKVNTSQFTYEIIKDFFVCTYRGEIEAKNIGSVKAYFVERILPEFSADADGFVPNEKFYALEKERFGA